MIANQELGKLISIEGVDGVGKSTLIANLKQYFDRKQQNIIYTQEPGGTQVSNSIRGILLGTSSEQLHPLSELLLVVSSRLQHHENLIKPHLKKDVWVVTDRYFDSTFAYQGAGRGIDSSIIEQLHDLYPFIIPDLTILLTGGLLEENILRSEQRDWEHDDDSSGAVRLLESHANQLELGFIDRFENETHRFKKRVAAGFIVQAKKFPQRFVIIPEGLSKEEVCTVAIEHIEKLYVAK